MAIEKTKKQKVKLLILAKIDFSNAGYLYYQSIMSLNSKNYQCRIFNVNKHDFDYPLTAPLFSSLDDIKDSFKWSNIIQLMHSQRVLDKEEYLQLLKIKKNRKLVMFHGGSLYRQNYELKNDRFNSVIDASIIQTPDLLNLGAKNQYWFLAPVDTKFLNPKNTKETNDEIIIGHLPSNANYKGTEIIANVLNNLNLEFKFKILHTEDRLKWLDYLDFLRQCDIYIDGIKPFQRDKKYGTFGITTKECAALGVIPMSHFLPEYQIKYKKYYDTNIGFRIINSEEELIGQLISLLCMSKEELKHEKIKAREWVVKNHSLKITGKRIIEEFYLPLLNDELKEIKY
jgi:hypothetical protein